MESSKQCVCVHITTIINEIKLNWIDLEKRNKVPRKSNIFHNSLHGFINQQLDKIKMHSCRIS